MTHANDSISGFLLNRPFAGQIIESPHEITVEDYWRTRWSSIFPISQRVHTSLEYARSCGFSEIPFPSDLLLNMTLSFALDPLSEHCRYHLDIENARQENSVNTGDTLRSFSRVEEVRNTSRGDASVISMTHILVNQNQQRVFSLLMRYFFDPLDNPSAQQETTPPSSALRYFQQAAGFFTDRYKDVEQFPDAPQSTLKRGEVLFHKARRPIAWSENLAISTMLQESHPIHWDEKQYGRDGLMISGGLIYSLVSALSNRDFSQVLDEVVLHCSHLQHVSPGDQVSAVSRILAAEPIDDQLETIRVKTLGLKNWQPKPDKKGTLFPLRLLKEKQRSRSEIENLCRDEAPELSEKIVLQSVRSLIRPRSKKMVKILSQD